MWGKGGRAHRPRVLERLGEPGFQELAQLGCRLELWNGIQFLECRRERIGETPDRSWPEFLVLWLEVEVMHAAGEVFWSFQSLAPAIAPNVHGPDAIVAELMFSQRARTARDRYPRRATVST